MPWFPVDDSFHSHPKVLATSLAARGLWVTAGSWSNDHAHPTDGVISDHVLASLGGTPELAAELVAAGLWRRTRKGYVFHDWFGWGPKRSAKQIRELSAVRAVNGRKGGTASGTSRRANGVNTPKQTLHDPVPTHPPQTGNDTVNQASGHAERRSKREASHEANAKQTRSPLDPQPLPEELTPQPPASGGHDGSHPNCRACGTNPRGKPPDPPPTPLPPPVSEVIAANGRPLRGQGVAAIAAQVRQAIAKEAP